MVTTVFTGGTIVIDSEQNGKAVTTDAIAFKGSTVAAHGEEATALLKAAPEAKHIDLAGGTLLPAPGDGHAHPVLGALEGHGPNIRAANDLQGIIDAVAEWKKENPEAEWIVGGSYDATFVEGGMFDARWLDEVTGDTPTILRAWDYHTAWVNTAALKAAGITNDTPDPHLGRIVRREDGSPMGTLQEAAANNVLANVVPPFSLETRVSAIENATREYAALGMTWVQDAWIDPADIETYHVAAKENRLHTRVNLAFRADPGYWQKQVAEFAAEREKIRTLNHDRLTGETIKFFIDGVIENHTAALTDPYADRPNEKGLPNWTESDLIEAVKEFGSAGFQLHLHAIGDAATRVALNALEALKESGKDNPNPHVIAHVGMLAPGQAERFAQLGAIANFEPFWAQCDAVMQSLTIPHIGENREDWQYQIGSVLKHGGTISFGSDWPVTTKDWREAMSTAITRHSHLEPEAESWTPNERVTPNEALTAYTKSIAAQALAKNRGTLQIGQVADAIWMADNPLEIDPTKIPDTEVKGTWLAGDQTFIA